MTHHDDDQLAAWLADGPHHGPVGVLGDALARAHGTGQRPGWLVRATGGTIAQPGDSLLRYAMVALTVAALLGILAGALIAGRVLPPPDPRPPVLVDKSAEPSASPQSGLVAYVVTRQRQPGEGKCPKDGDQPSIWCTVSQVELANQDGSDAHHLVAGGGLVGWAADGSALLLEGNGLRIVDPSGTVLARYSGNELCRLPCAGMESFSVSPDGARISFVRFYPDVDNGTVIAILDLASREVTELESTRTTNGSDLEQCWLSTRCEGQDDTPRWSPDGSRLAFARQVMSPEPGSSWTSAAVYVLNADGSDLQRVTPEGWYAFNASWSPDGSALAFVNAQMIVNDDHTSVTDDLYDIYTVRADGAGVRQLTDNGSSYGPVWTEEGQLTFVHQVGSEDAAEFQNWIMGPDGSGKAQLGSTLGELTAAGCVACIYPVDQGESHAYWQPMP